MSRQRRQVPMEHRPRPTDVLKLSGPENTRGTYGLNLKGSVSRLGFRGLCRATDLVASPYGHHVVATQREIVKAGGVSVPPGHVHRIASHDMRCGTHLDRPWPCGRSSSATSSSIAVPGEMIRGARK